MNVVVQRTCSPHQLARTDSNLNSEPNTCTRVDISLMSVGSLRTSQSEMFAGQEHVGGCQVMALDIYSHVGWRHSALFSRLLSVITMYTFVNTKGTRLLYTVYPV